jgi:hypothetical protein
MGGYGIREGPECPNVRRYVLAGYILKRRCCRACERKVASLVVCDNALAEH